MDGERALWVTGSRGCDWNCRNAYDPDGPLTDLIIGAFFFFLVEHSGILVYMCALVYEKEKS